MWRSSCRQVRRNGRVTLDGTWHATVTPHYSTSTPPPTMTYRDRRHGEALLLGLQHPAAPDQLDAADRFLRAHAARAGTARRLEFSCIFAAPLATPTQHGTRIRQVRHNVAKLNVFAADVATTHPKVPRTRSACWHPRNAPLARCWHLLLVPS